MSAPPALELRGARKVYPGGGCALRGADLTIAPGEFVVVVGPSGCGKSTMLRVIAGLEEASGGDIFIDGERVTDHEPARRDIAMVFQNYALYPHMSARRNMAYSLKNRKMSDEEIERRIEWAAAILNLEGLLERRPRELSGGQRQRVAMGRAIVRRPRLFLFDEPLSNLDAKLRAHMRVEIRRLQRRLETASVYVTHDQTEAMTLGDRLVIMRDGEIEQVGAPLDLYERPASVYVAAFIGSPTMNIWPATVADGAARIDGADGPPLPAPGVADGAVLIGVRPEHIRPARAGDAGFAFKSDIVERLGAEILIHGQIGGKSAAVMRLGEDAAGGETSQIAFDPARLHFFDPADERRLEMDV